MCLLGTFSAADSSTFGSTALHQHGYVQEQGEGKDLLLKCIIMGRFLKIQTDGRKSS